MAEDTPPDPIDLCSPLYSRVNGFMFGAALLVAALVDDGRYEDRRKRLNSFLRESMVPLQLPPDRSELEPLYRQTASKLLGPFREASEELADFHALATFVLTSRPDGSPASPEVDAEIERIRRQYELPEAPFDEFTRTWRTTEAAADRGARLTPAISLLQSLIQDLPVEPDTCFVSMPFSPEYEQLWGTFLWPLADVIGVRPVRAWGDISGEDYQGLMFTMIDKCGMLLADVTGNGPNVTSELGYAMGGKKQVMVISADESPVPISNIHPDWIFRYRTDVEPDWTAPAIVQGLHWSWGVRAAFDQGFSMMSPNHSPGRLMDILFEGGAEIGETFFMWEGRGDQLKSDPESAPPGR